MRFNIFLYFVVLLTIVGTARAGIIDSNLTIEQPLNVTNHTYTPSGTGMDLVPVAAEYSNWNFTFPQDGGLTCDGTAEYVNTTYSPNENKLYEGGCYLFTIAFVNEVGAYMFGSFQAGAGDNAYYIYRDGSTALGISAKASGTQAIDRVTNGSLFDNKPHNIVFCWNATNQTMMFFADQVKYKSALVGWDDVSVGVVGAKNLTINEDNFLCDLDYQGGSLGPWACTISNFGFLPMSANPYNLEIQRKYFNTSRPRNYGTTPAPPTKPNTLKINMTSDGGQNATVVSLDKWNLTTAFATPNPSFVYDTNQGAYIFINDNNNSANSNWTCSATSGNGTTQSSITLCDDKALTSANKNFLYFKACNFANMTLCESNQELEMIYKPTPTVVIGPQTVTSGNQSVVLPVWTNASEIQSYSSNITNVGTSFQSANGTLFIQPSFQDIGTTSIFVSAYDGTSNGTGTFQLTVTACGGGGGDVTCNNLIVSDGCAIVSDGVSGFVGRG